MASRSVGPERWSGGISLGRGSRPMQAVGGLFAMSADAEGTPMPPGAVPRGTAPSAGPPLPPAPLSPAAQMGEMSPIAPLDVPSSPTGPPTGPPSGAPTGP
jgi:hypothetical protein